MMRQGRLARVDETMERSGLFLAQEKAKKVGRVVRDEALRELGLPASVRERLPLLSMAVLGLAENGVAYERVLLPVAQCVHQAAQCAVGREMVEFANHLGPLPDQGVLSVVAEMAGIETHSQKHGELAFGSGTEDGLFRRVGAEGEACDVIFRRGACVLKQQQGGVVKAYLFGGRHKVGFLFSLSPSLSLPPSHSLPFFRPSLSLSSLSTAFSFPLTPHTDSRECGRLILAARMMR